MLAVTFNYAIINHAVAQQPTQAQRDAIRASCRSDFISNCAGVEPGGKEALECLLRNESKLSSACQGAVSAVAVKATEPPAVEPAAKSETTAPAAPAAQSASSDDQLKSVQKACTISDLMAHCSWLQPSNPEILLCLKANSGDLSPGCPEAHPPPQGRRHRSPSVMLLSQKNPPNLRRSRPSRSAPTQNQHS
jgi:hypothetical protein